MDGGSTKSSFSVNRGRFHLHTKSSSSSFDDDCDIGDLYSIEEPLRPSLKVFEPVNVPVWDPALPLWQNQDRVRRFDEINMRLLNKHLRLWHSAGTDNIEDLRRIKTQRENRTQSSEEPIQKQEEEEEDEEDEEEEEEVLVEEVQAGEKGDSDPAPVYYGYDDTCLSDYCINRLFGENDLGSEDYNGHSEESSFCEAETDSAEPSENNQDDSPVQMIERNVSGSLSNLGFNGDTSSIDDLSLGLQEPVIGDNDFFQMPNPEQPIAAMLNQGDNKLANMQPTGNASDSEDSETTEELNDSNSGSGSSDSSSDVSDDSEESSDSNSSESSAASDSSKDSSESENSKDSGDSEKGKLSNDSESNQETIENKNAEKTPSKGDHVKKSLDSVIPSVNDLQCAAKKDQEASMHASAEEDDKNTAKPSDNVKIPKTDAVKDK